MRAIDAQIGAVGIIFVVTHTTVAGDTAVHFVRDERPQIPVAVGTFGETVATETVTRHHGHILKMAVTALFTNRTVVRVVSHQPLHHAFTELFRFFVVNRDKGTVGGWRHTGHHPGDHAYLPRFGIASPHTGGKHRRFPAPGASKKYGISRPRDRHACSRLSAPLTSYSLPST